MDGRTFDALAATLAAPHSRRGFARLVAGGALGALSAIAARDVTDAKAHANATAPSAVTLQPKRAHPPAAEARAAAQAAAATTKASRKKQRCRYSQTICSHNGQCCPTTSGFICAWNGNNEGAPVCCGVNGARCLGDYDCCNQGLCFFGVCVG
jgi:hypothetical protein